MTQTTIDSEAADYRTAFLKLHDQRRRELEIVRVLLYGDPQSLEYRRAYRTLERLLP